MTIIIKFKNGDDLKKIIISWCFILLLYSEEKTKPKYLNKSQLFYSSKGHLVWYFSSGPSFLTSMHSPQHCMWCKLGHYQGIWMRWRCCRGSRIIIWVRIWHQIISQPKQHDFMIDQIEFSNNVQPTRSDDNNNDNSNNNQSSCRTMSNQPDPRARLTSLLSLALSGFSANFRSASLSWTFRLTLVPKRNLSKRMILSQMAAVGEVMKSKLSGELIAGILWLPPSPHTALNLLLTEDQLFLLLLTLIPLSLLAS